MKHCSRRLMALLLSAILCVQLLPAMVRAEEGTAAASEGKGAFGLPAATGLTEDSAEYNSAVADAPFGSSGRAVPLFVQSELMLSYSWGGAPLYSHTYDYNGDGGEAGNLMGAFPNLANQYRVTFNPPGFSASQLPCGGHRRREYRQRTPGAHRHDRSECGRDRAVPAGPEQQCGVHQHGVPRQPELDQPPCL